MSNTITDIEGLISDNSYKEEDGFLWGPCPKNTGFGNRGLRIRVSDKSFCCFACRLHGSSEDLLWHIKGTV